MSLLLLLLQFPPLPPTPDTRSHGAGVQRTMGLLASSTPERRNRVKILFYGQSITEQEWSKEVARWLREKYPHADLTIENRAIGGFASQWLVRPAEHQLYPFYPDLMIFHVYGANNTYEEILRETRRRTTAEVLIQTDHVTQWPADPPDEKKDKGLWWDHMMNNVFLPEYANKYRCGTADVRRGWLDYLKAHTLEPRALLKDAVHLNDHGNFVMAELLKRYLVHKPELMTDEARAMVRDVPVAWKDGRFTLEFEGNRVDAILSARGAVRVTIDGRKPSEVPELYARTLPGPTQAGYWPGIKRVTGTTTQVEEWAARITTCDGAATDFTFEVRGSKTGPDGSGNNKAKFVSPSGRVVIEPDDWHLHTTALQKALTPGFEVRWSVTAMHADHVEEGRVTVAQGLVNGKHTLQLAAEGAPPAVTIRIYRPPVP